MKSICVYCGSNPGARSEYIESAMQLGRFLAEKEIELVYGGAEVGLMGAVASETLKNGGKVTGVITEFLADKVAHNNLNYLYVVPTMHERKTQMFELSDGFIALPGGIGTIEELLEVLTWAQLGSHDKPCGMLNICGYFDSLLEFLDNAVNQQFVMQAHRDMLLIDNDPKALLMQFETYKAPVTEKWISKN